MLGPEKTWKSQHQAPQPTLSQDQEACERPDWLQSPRPIPLNGAPDLQAVIPVMVVGDSQNPTGPQAVRKAEIGVGQMGQTRTHEVEEALPSDGGDLRTHHSLAPRPFTFPIPLYPPPPGPGDQIWLVTQQMGFFS